VLVGNPTTDPLQIEVQVACVSSSNVSPF